MAKVGDTAHAALPGNQNGHFTPAAVFLRRLQRADGQQGARQQAQSGGGSAGCDGWRPPAPLRVAGQPDAGVNPARHATAGSLASRRLMSWQHPFNLLFLIA